MQTKFKTIGLYLGILFSLPIIFTSCGSDDSTPPNPPLPNGITPPTAAQFKALKENALNSRTHTKDFVVDPMPYIDFDSPKGTTVSLNYGELNIAGVPLELGSTAQIEFIELYTKADLVLTGIGTVGKHPNGDLEMLETGGAFYVGITKDGVQVQTTSTHLSLDVPYSLTSEGGDSDMILWTGDFNERGNLVWEQLSGNLELGGVQKGETSYYAAIMNHLGWINIDHFWDDPRPKTSITFTVPQGYSSSNSEIFLSFNDVLGILWYDGSDIPIGAEGNAIFVSEYNGKWVYAIKPFTVAENLTIQILSSDLQTATETELEAKINALP